MAYVNAADKEALNGLGYNDANIAGMTPELAEMILATSSPFVGNTQPQEDTTVYAALVDMGLQDVTDGLIDAGTGIRESVTAYAGKLPLVLFAVGAVALLILFRKG